MSEANKAVVKQLYDLINAGNVDGIDAVVSESFVEHEQNGGSPDREGVKAFFKMVLVAFPDMKMEVTHMTADSDMVAAFVTVKGTQKGEFMGIPATNKPVSMNIADLMRVENGKVVEHWGVTDMMAMMQQLGVIPS